MSGIPVKPTSRRAIWEFVRDIRHALGVETALYFDIVWFVESILPNLFAGFVLEICTKEEMGELHGKTIPSENKICLREDVYIGACAGNGRDRFTLAHEVGHFLLHGERSIEFCRYEPDGTVPCYCDSEWQACVFAGELLAPSYLIDGMPANEVHQACGISLPCANTQLRAVAREKAKR